MYLDQRKARLDAVEGDIVFMPVRALDVFGLRGLVADAVPTPISRL